MTKNLAFKATNRHVEGCGDPPEWCSKDSEPGHRRFYMENFHGEQLVVEVSLKIFRFVLGDAQWGHETCVVDPDYTALVAELDRGMRGSIPSFRNLVLDRLEFAMIRVALLVGWEMSESSAMRKAAGV